MNEKSEKPIHLAGVNLGRHRHVCAFFGTPDQEDKVIIPFLKEGIDSGERAFCISSTEMRTSLLQKLRGAGTDVAMAEKRDQLKIEQWGKAVVGSGRFDQDAMLARIEGVLSQGKEKGFGLTRFVGRMDWVREYSVGINELVEYETRLNRIWRKFNDPIICVYDLSTFNAGALVNILRTHPVAIIGDVVAENPFFDPPEVILQELNERSNEADGRMDG
jgi:MEDS: MEthanogen/methylotroph, DcmR Sensory domain